MMRRALITGAGGFVGGYLSEHLRALGWDVLGADLRPPGDDAHFKTCDIASAEEADALLRWAAPVSHVFHLAAVTFVPASMKHPGQTVRVNLEGTVNIAEAMMAHARNARLVYVGSAECYGPPAKLPVTEDAPLNPVNPYAITKAAGDQYCAYLHAAGRLDTVRMRPFNHSGPGQPDQFVLPSFARQVAEMEAAERPPVLRVGNLDAARDFLHVEDVVRAYALAAEQGVAGAAYNVSTGRSHWLRDVVEMLQSMAEVEIRVEIDPERFREVDVKTFTGSSARLTQDTGWTPRYELKDILQSLLDHWRAAVR